jgi:glycosyltransferase involved in cell wall biosynthesis
MKIVQISTDNRENDRAYELPNPYFGTAPEALFEGFAELPEVEIHVVSCSQQPVRAPQKLADNLWFHSLHVPRLGWMRTAYQGCVRAVRQKIRELQPTIVHGQGTERYCALAAAFSGAPSVVTIHGNMAELARHFRSPLFSFGWLAARLEDFTLRRTSGVFCNSAYTEALVAPRAARVWRVPNAIRGLFFTPRTAERRMDPPRLVNVGVVGPRKRQVELIEALLPLHAEGARFALDFAGPCPPDSDYSRRFLALLAEPSVARFARHLGELRGPALLETLDQAAALVHFPTEESFGLVIAEALARSLPVFCARVGGIVDVSERDSHSPG